jgi:hypothetical protein
VVVAEGLGSGVLEVLLASGASFREACDLVAEADPEGVNAVVNAHLARRPFEGFLDFAGCSWLTSLPDGLVVEGSLLLDGTALTTLPSGLKVKDRLSLKWATLACLPIDLVVCDLDLAHSRVALPEGLRVGRFLNFWKAKITTLPDRLWVGGSLDLDETPIQALPEGLFVGGRLDMRNCHRWDGQVPEDAQIVEGIRTDREPDGIVLEDWHLLNPRGERQ